MAPVACITGQIEKHYTINDLTELLSMSFERVRQLVKDEPGVLVIPSSSISISRSKRTRNSYRIPASVVQRLLRRYANPVVPSVTRSPQQEAAPQVLSFAAHRPRALQRPA